jgi:hypothetical protein
MPRTPLTGDAAHDVVPVSGGKVEVGDHQLDARQSPEEPTNFFAGAGGLRFE